MVYLTLLKKKWPCQGREVAVPSLHVLLTSPRLARRPQRVGQSTGRAATASKAALSSGLHGLGHAREKLLGIDNWGRKRRVCLAFDSMQEGRLNLVDGSHFF